MSDTKSPAAEPAAPKKSRAKLFIILSVVLLLLGGGGAAAYWTMLRPAAAEGAEAHTEAHEEVEPTGIVGFEPFVVNLADANARRFLRITVRLIVESEEEAKHIEENQVTLMRLRSEILELLTAQTSEQIVTLDGKAALKKQIAERASAVAAPIEVSDVLFSDFVVQY